MGFQERAQEAATMTEIDDLMRTLQHESRKLDDLLREVSTDDAKMETVMAELRKQPHDSRDCALCRLCRGRTDGRAK